MWIVEMRRRTVDLGVKDAVEDQTTSARPRSTQRRAAAYDDSDDPALRSYNHYLAWLNAHPHATPAEYPGES
jgi:hypothetical protein